MLVEDTPAGRVFELRPRGVGRWLAAGFLVVWLAFWAVGEAVAGWIVVKGAAALLTGQPPGPGDEPVRLGPAVAVGAFLLLWLSFWTIGGIAAFRELLRSTAGWDRLVAGPAGLTVVRGCGPLRRTREIPREAIRRIFLVSRHGTLTAETAKGPVDLSAFGTPAEREEVAALLRSELRLRDAEGSGSDGALLPEGWQEVIDPEGGIALVPDLARRRTQAKVAIAAALVATAVAVALAAESATSLPLIPLAVLVGAATAALWWGALRLLRGRPEWRIGVGAVTLRRRYGSGVRDRFFADALELGVSRDDDGDDWYSLDALAPGAGSPVGPAKARKSRRTIAKALHDPTIPRQVGAWLARRAAIPLTDRTTEEAQAAEALRLKEQLRRSGRLGRAVAAWIERREPRRRS